jgi:hypothetical protein
LAETPPPLVVVAGGFLSKALSPAAHHRLPLAALFALVLAWAAYQVKSALGIDIFPHGGLHIDLHNLVRAFLHR